MQRLHETEDRMCQSVRKGAENGKVLVDILEDASVFAELSANDDLSNEQRAAELDKARKCVSEAAQICKNCVLHEILPDSLRANTLLDLLENLCGQMDPFSADAGWRDSLRSAAKLSGEAFLPKEKGTSKS